MKISATIAVLVVAALGAGIAIAAHARDGAVIHNTGSTNFSGYTIKLRSDGSASFVRSTRGGDLVGAATIGSIPSDLAQKFFSDLKAAKMGGTAGRPCVKSASFGSATVVQYHGWTSPDLECPGAGVTVALSADVREIAATLQVQAAPVRRPLLPNEPRRAPETSPSQATPKPESIEHTP